ncbi:ABC transporter ATP-binding protein [Spongorhabdus nitratireducens]
MSFVCISDFCKRFATHTVFENISCEIKQGEFITLLGPSGCGKSTLLRCIAGLTTVDHGTLTVNGEDITNQIARLRGIAMVFQSYALFPNMSVYDNVAFGLKMQKIPKAQREPRVREILEMVELESYHNRYPQQLSGGQCQRVALARSLVVRPRILLLDEPLSALDARIRKNLRDQIRRIQQELKLTTIFVTHDQEEALTLSDRILLMNDGQIVQTGTAEEIYTEPASAFVAGFIGNYNLLDRQQARQVLGLDISHQLAIRPESIYVRESGRDYGGKDLIPASGIVTGHNLLGNVIRYHLDITGVPVIVDLLNRSSERLFTRGSELDLLFNRDEIREVS